MGSVALPFVFLFAFFIFSPLLAENQDPSVLLSCLNGANIPPSSISSILHTPNETNYSSLLYFSMQNLRFTSSDSLKPFFIITPQTEPQVQASVICGKKNGFQIRIRSGGHDYEGLSYASKTPFVILDLMNLRNIEIDAVTNTAWVQGGATLGEVYYRVADKSTSLAFPAGVCSTVGLSGHAAGGGVGMMSRKYGLASDHVIDARIVDANGRILDRNSMGEDLFWAIRGGGGNSFGVMTAWKIQLVPVPQTVSVFSVFKTARTEALNLLSRWQQIVHTLPEELFIRAVIYPKTINKVKTIQLGFDALYLGSARDLILLMQQRFPELGLKIEGCKEMKWIESVLNFDNFAANAATSVLLDRNYKNKRYFKSKSDFVKIPIPKSVWGAVFDRLLQQQSVSMMMDPHGGKMFGVLENEFPFPHRYDNIYHIKYTASWNSIAEEAAKIQWIRDLYAFMAPYVTQNPRGAYINYRDLDVGMDVNGSSTYEDSLEWGLKYFKGNYKRLALVKARVDPENFFRNEQSVRPLKASSTAKKK